MQQNEFLSRPGTQASRPGTQASALSSARSSLRTGDASNRASVVSSRISFAAFMADGRTSMIGSRMPGGPQVSGTMMLSMGTKVPLVGPRPPLSPAEAAAQAERRRLAEQQRAVAKLPGILQKLALVERAVQLSTHHPRVAKYMNVLLCAPARHKSDQQQPRAPDAAAVATAATAPAATARQAAAGDAQLAATQTKGTELQLLWTWQADVTGELAVSCLAWSRTQPDLLAVGYGRLEYTLQDGGMVAIWSLRSPAHPLWHFRTPCGVSALDFGPSKAPGTLALGSFDGSVALYDVRARSARPLVRAPPEAVDGSGGHADPVCQLRYVPCSSDGEESLISISSDGLVAEWKQAQGLERVEVMRLRRQGGGTGVQKAAGAAAGGAEEERPKAAAAQQQLLAHYAGGTCFDFSPADDNRVFLAGTEDGAVLRCSTAFTEALETYNGHVGTVYQASMLPYVLLPTF